MQSQTTVGDINKLKVRAALDGSVEKNIFHMFTDKLDCYSPSIRRETLYTLLSWGVFHNMDISSWDINQTFARTPYDRPNPLFTYIDYKGTRTFYRVLAMMYGLPEASRKWYEWLRKFLEQQQFVVSKWDHCLFVKTTPAATMVCGISTDDSLTLTTNNDAGRKMKSDLFAAMTAMGWKYTIDITCEEFLSIRLTRLPNNSLHLSTPSKIESLKRHCFSNSDPPKVYNPWLPNWTLALSEGSPPADKTWMRTATGLVNSSPINI